MALITGMDGATATLLAAVVALLGVVFGQVYSAWGAAKRSRIEFELARVEAQIRTFWGPLDTLAHQVLTVHATREAMIRDLEAFGRLHTRSEGAVEAALDYTDPVAVAALAEDPLHKVNYHVWQKFFLPLHIEIQTVIKEHRDQIEGPLPESFKVYLQHSIGEQMRYSLREDHEGVETFGVTGVRWPDAFVTDVDAGLKTARHVQRALLDRLR
ncbi:MAG: hypothetical protein AAF503_12675 [Pseudomonadota bacterium]